MARGAMERVDVAATTAASAVFTTAHDQLKHPRARRRRLLLLMCMCRELPPAHEHEPKPQPRRPAGKLIQARSERLHSPKPHPTRARAGCTLQKSYKSRRGQASRNFCHNAPCHRASVDIPPDGGYKTLAPVVTSARSWRK